MESIHSSPLQVFLDGDLHSRPYAQPVTDLKYRVTRLFHHHPSLLPIVESVTAVSGILLATSAAVLRYSLTRVVALASFSVLSLAIAVVSHKILRVIAPFPHKMESHELEPGAVEGGRLYYRNDLPVLELNGKSPYNDGFAHGYLMAPALRKMRANIHFARHTLLRTLPAAELTNTLQEVRQFIPKRLIQEMEGLVAGFNKRRSDEGWNCAETTLDELVLVHLLPDSKHFHPDHHEASTTAPSFIPQLLSSLAAEYGCTVLIGGDATTGPVIARNMDWPSLGVFGKYSFILERRSPHLDRSTKEISIPGLVGTLTGINDKGLFVAMNVTDGETAHVEGIPASLFLRTCLDECASVVDAMKYVNLQPTLGPFHLTVADGESANTVHFHQGENQAPHIQRWTGDAPLVIANCRYEPAGRVDAHPSKERHETWEQFAEDISDRGLGNGEDVLRAATQLPYINNPCTVHSAIIRPRDGSMKVAFDNGWAAWRELHVV